MSSSRVQINFTGAPTAFDASTAAGTKSTSRRRPKPPPSKVVCTLTCPASARKPRPPRPASSAAPGCRRRRSQRSALTSAVQFMGSMVACASSGSSYTAANVFAARLERCGRHRRGTSSPRARGSGGRAASSSARIAALSSRALAPVVPGDLERITRLVRLPEMLRHDHDAAGRWQHPPHAGQRLRAAASRPLRLATEAGLSAMTAYSMPGSCTSSPNSALPSTLAGVSSRGRRFADQAEIGRRP